MTTMRTTPPATADGRVAIGRSAPSLAIAAALVGTVLALAQAAVPPMVPADRFSAPFSPELATVVAVVLAVLHLAIVPLMALVPRIAAPGALGRVAGAITCVGLVGLAVAELVSIAAVHEVGMTPLVDLVSTGYSAPTILVGIGEVLLGIAVIRAGRWQGWARVSVLIAGIFVFVPLIPALVVGGPVRMIALGVWSLLYLAIAIAARHQGRTAAR